MFTIYYKQVKNISCLTTSVQPNSISKTTISKLLNSFRILGNITSPIVVLEKGNDTYEVVYGHAEYFMLLEAEKIGLIKNPIPVILICGENLSEMDIKNIIAQIKNFNSCSVKSNSRIKVTLQILPNKEVQNKETLEVEEKIDSAPINLDKTTKQQMNNSTESNNLSENNNDIPETKIINNPDTSPEQEIEPPTKKHKNKNKSNKNNDKGKIDENGKESEKPALRGKMLEKILSIKINNHGTVNVCQIKCPDNITLSEEREKVIESGIKLFGINFTPVVLYRLKNPVDYITYGVIFGEEIVYVANKINQEEVFCFVLEIEEDQIEETRSKIIEMLKVMLK